MHPLPANRPPRRETFPNRGQNRSIRPKLGMTGHTGLRWRKAGERGVFHRCVAITAVDSQIARVMLMAERNGLFQLETCDRRIRRPKDGVERPPSASNCERNCHNSGPDNCVGLRFKNLRHGITSVFEGFKKPPSARSFPKDTAEANGSGLFDLTMTYRNQANMHRRKPNAVPFRNAQLNEQARHKIEIDKFLDRSELQEVISGLLKRPKKNPERTRAYYLKRLSATRAQMSGSQSDDLINRITS